MNLHKQLQSANNSKSNNRKILPVSRTVSKRSRNGRFVAIGALAAVAPHVTRSFDALPR